jgi:hypothetical protein
MYKVASAIVICAMLGWSQEPPLREKTALPAPRLDKGSVDGGIYKNPSIGLELTPDPKLKLGTPALKGKPGGSSTSLTIMAVGKLRSGSARELTAFWAIPLAQYPADERSTDAVMRRVVEADQKDGLRPIRSSIGALGVTSFARMDFSHGDHPAYEAVFVKTCETLALGFVFAGSDQDAVNKIIAATDVKLDLAASGCGPK